MSKVILVRHAQASLGKANYDELSQRGFKQAELLGNYFSQYYQKPSTIISGTLKRHEQTAQALSTSIDVSTRCWLEWVWLQEAYPPISQAKT